jgi:hypothetical protein
MVDLRDHPNFDPLPDSESAQGEAETPEQKEIDKKTKEEN